MKYVFKHPPRSLAYAFYPKKSPRSYFSVPFPSKYHDDGNVLAFYEDPRLIPAAQKDVPVDKLPIEDVKYLATVLRMPAIVVMATYADAESGEEVCDVYFMSPRIQTT